MEMFINKDTVRTLRLEKSWSQEKLAEAANMNLRTLQRIEKDGVASLRSCESLASALGVEPQELRIGAKTEIASSQPQASHTQLVPAAWIMAVILMLWGLAQLAAPFYELSPFQSSIISFFLLFFAAFILLAFLTPIAKKRFYIGFGCVVLAMIISPPDALASIKMALPLVLSFEFSLFLAKRFGKRGAAFSDTI
jgi:transcriptional regulator with XRE-family HTH domain